MLVQQSFRSQHVSSCCPPRGGSYCYQCKTKQPEVIHDEASHCGTCNHKHCYNVVNYAPSPSSDVEHVYLCDKSNGTKQPSSSKIAALLLRFARGSFCSILTLVAFVVPVFYKSTYDISLRASLPICEAFYCDKSMTAGFFWLFGQWFRGTPTHCLDMIVFAALLTAI